MMKGFRKGLQGSTMMTIVCYCSQGFFNVKGKEVSIKDLMELMLGGVLKANM